MFTRFVSLSGSWLAAPSPNASLSQRQTIVPLPFVASRGAWSWSAWIYAKLLLVTAPPELVKISS
jgi:hypothetical protein